MKKIKEEINKNISKRSLSRLMAVQTLYQYQYHGEENDILKIMDEVIDNYAIDPNKEDASSYRKKIDITFLRNLISGITLVLDKIDKKIAESLEENHNFKDIPDVMLQILRFGTFELQFMKENPFKVIINEYVDITNSFYDKNKINFVNAILDKIAKDSKA